MLEIPLVEIKIRELSLQIPSNIIYKSSAQGTIILARVLQVINNLACLCYCLLFQNSQVIFIQEGTKRFST